MAIIKGSYRRIVREPGYHIHPKYDLHGIRDRLYHGERGDGHADLPLTAMVDMMSILVIFLIMNFSSTGEVFFMSKDVKMPQAKHSRPIESYPVISILKNGAVSLDADKAGDASKGEGAFHVEEANQNFPILRARLQQIRIMDQTVHPDRPFKGNVNLQADEGTPIEQIKRVMNALVAEGWSGIHFAVRPPQTTPPPGEQTEKKSE